MDLSSRPLAVRTALSGSSCPDEYCEICGEPQKCADMVCASLWGSPFLEIENNLLEIMPPFGKRSFGIKVKSRLPAVDLPLPSVQVDEAEWVWQRKVDEENKDVCLPPSLEVPLDEHDILPSAGSARHATGDCRPCAFMDKEIGCRGGLNCNYCHFEHGGRARVRPCKGKRERYRKCLQRFQAEIDAYIACGRPLDGIADHILSLEIPSMIENDERLKNHLFAMLTAYMQHTYGRSVDMVL
mmetsp:Transcript_39955/g.105291  ORF Transcript_39955/g.105291 Transcript_39955/m.105291 type:complete len:241 (-) Transcript_39955:4-726(-)